VTVASTSYLPGGNNGRISTAWIAPHDFCPGGGVAVGDGSGDGTDVGRVSAEALVPTTVIGAVARPIFPYRMMPMSAGVTVAPDFGYTSIGATSIGVGHTPEGGSEEQPPVNAAPIAASIVARAVRETFMPDPFMAKQGEGDGFGDAVGPGRGTMPPFVVHAPSMLHRMLACRADHERADIAFIAQRGQYQAQRG
jgi:hypothetical protein